MTPNHLGAKLRHFRLRNRISQLDLENNAGLATGSLTKIESGKVIPNYYTLTKIITGLKLSPYEHMMFHQYSSDFTTGLLEHISELQLIEDEKKIAQLVANYLPKALKLLGLSFSLIYEGKLYNVAFTNSWYTDFLIGILPVPYQEFNLDMQQDVRHSLLVRCIVENREYTSAKLTDFTQPYLANGVTNLLQKTANVRSLLAMPLVVRDQAIGAILYAQDHQDGFDSLIPILKTYTQLVATVIFTLRQTQKVTI